MTALKIEARLRLKNQITLPEKIVACLGVGPGDRFVFMMEDGENDVVHLGLMREEGRRAARRRQPEESGCGNAAGLRCGCGRRHAGD